MKALTISQPFASLIASGEKWVENRSWETLYRGPLAIHAGKGTQYLDKKQLAEYPHGCVVAAATLVACVRLQEMSDRPAGERIRGSRRTVLDLIQHEHAEGPFCWVLEDVRVLDEPVPYRGSQGLWDFPLTLDLAIELST